MVEITLLPNVFRGLQLVLQLPAKEVMCGIRTQVKVCFFGRVNIARVQTTIKK